MLSACVPVKEPSHAHETTMRIIRPVWVDHKDGMLAIFHARITGEGQPKPTDHCLTMQLAPSSPLIFILKAISLQLPGKVMCVSEQITVSCRRHSY